MSQRDHDAKDFARMLRYAAECIEYYQRVSSFDDCNNCGKNRTCKYLPGWGEQTRINCPLWTRKVSDSGKSEV